MIKVPDVYQIKVELKGISPSIWRRLLLPDDLFLHDLHKIIQTAMGWENMHLHEFVKNGRTFGPSDDENESSKNFIDYTSVRLKDILKSTGESFQYIYDFGDYWVHDIILEDILSPDNSGYYPVCIDGERNCPPEDCGGAPGYKELLKVINLPGHPDREALLDWLDADWEAEEFDVEYTNGLLLEDDFGCLPLID